MPHPFTFQRFAWLHSKFGTEITPRLTLSLAVMFILMVTDPMPVQAQVQSGKIYVTLFGERGVAVVDAVGVQDGRLQVNDVIPVGEKPAQIAITPDGRYLLVPCEGPGALYVVATDTQEIVNEIATGGRAHGVDVSDDGRHAFVSNWADNSVSVIDLGQATVIATIPVGRELAGIDFVVQP